MALKFRLNPEKQEIEFSNGETRPLSDLDTSTRYELGASESAKDYEKQNLESYRKVYGNPLGTFSGKVDEGVLGLPGKGADFVLELGRSVVSRKGQDKKSYMERLGENWEALRRAKRQALAEGSEANPISSMLGSGAGIAADIALTLPFGGEGAFLRAPSAASGASSLARRVVTSPFSGNALVGAALSDKNIVEDPLGVAQDAAITGGVGKALSAIPAISRRRGDLRRHAEDLSAFTSSEANRLAQHEAAQAAYEAQVAGLPAAQRAAQQTVSQDVLANIGRLGREVPADSVSREALEVGRFIADTVDASAMAGTTEGNRLTNFLTRLVETRPETLNAGDLSKIFKAVEDRIAVAPNEAPILNAFKQHIADVAPSAFADSAAHRTYSTRILKPVRQAVDKTLRDLFIAVPESELNRLQPGIARALKDELGQAVESAIKNRSPIGFVESVQKGTLPQEVMQAVRSSPSIQKLEQAVMADIALVQGQLGGTSIKQALASNPHSERLRSLANLQIFFQNLEGNLLPAIERGIADQATAIGVKASDVADKTARRLAKTVGLAPQIQAPVAPAAFVAGQAPAAPEMTGIAGRLAAAFENPNFAGTVTNQFRHPIRNAGSAMLLNYLGIPKSVIGAAAGGTVLLRALSSPNPVIQFTVGLSGKMAVRSTIMGLAEQFPDMNELGVLETPESRMQAVSQIERDPSLSLTDKAVLQTKINRGEPLVKLESPL